MSETENPFTCDSFKGKEPIEQLRILLSSLDCEYETMLSQLPSIQALIDYRNLWNVYGTEFFSGIEESIAEGADIKPLEDFCKKHGLHWHKALKPAGMGREN